MQITAPLTARRITLRNYQKSDLSALTAMWFDPENGKYLSDPAEEYADETYRAALDKLETSPDGYYLTAVLNATDEIIGSCFMFPNRQGTSLELAYCIHKARWRKGYAAELLSLAIAWAADNGYTEITAETAKENTASNALLLKTGFTLTAESAFKKYNMNVTYSSCIYTKKLT